MKDLFYAASFLIHDFNINRMLNMHYYVKWFLTELRSDPID
jgi:hypothetical protein